MRVLIRMYIIDTDIAIEYLKGNEEVVQKLNRMDDCYLTLFNIAELFHGVFLSSNPEKHYGQVSHFINRFDKLTLDIGSSKIFAKIKVQLRKEGKLIPDFDILIASIALLYDFTVITRNVKDFERVKGIKLLKI